jgi:hypothetical protein
VKTAGRKIPRKGHLVGEVSQTENPLVIQEGTAGTREDMINEDFYNVCINDILKDIRYHRENTPKLYHLEAKIVIQYCKCIQSIIFDPHEVSSFSRKARPFFISYKCGSGGNAHDYLHYR